MHLIDVAAHVRRFIPGIVRNHQVLEILRLDYTAQAAFHGGGIFDDVAGHRDVAYAVNQEQSAGKIDHGIVDNGNVCETLSVDGFAVVVGHKLDKRSPIVDVAGFKGVVPDHQVIHTRTFHPAAGNNINRDEDCAV